MTASLEYALKQRGFRQRNIFVKDTALSETLCNKSKNVLNTTSTKRSLSHSDECLNEERESRRSKGSLATALTNYKKVVDIPRIYGLTNDDLKSTKTKIKRQSDFLDYSYIQDNNTGQQFSFKDCIVSSNHSPKRYYGEIQNRINTLEQEATNAKLTPVFLTITLPSEFHKMKTSRNGKLIRNPKYNGVEPKESVKILTKMFAKLRQDRSLKDLSKMQRMYYRVNEPHKGGTPHTHILLFIPKEHIERVEKAFCRLYNQKSNKFEKNIRSATSYIMKYINKTLPMSKKEITKKDEYLNAWYIKHRINRFCASRSTAPMYLYRMLNHRFSLYGLTQVRKGSSLKIFARIEDDKIIEIWDDTELLFMRQDNFTVTLMGNAAA
ncbi:MAG: replication endonuclease [Sulfurimonas sp.]|nr:replication endonuclease [Sulfurimonas sp.]MDD3834674.1 replication endonuclease [Sulfurimonas sp.]